MGTRTLSVDDDAYALLKAARRGDESFSEVIHRVLGGSQPSLLDLAGLLTNKEARAVERAIQRMRDADIATQKKRLARFR